MFFGEYPYKVDEKGRLPLPPKFRRQMKDGVILTKGTGERCVTVYPVAEFERMSKKLAERAVTPSHMRRLNRAIFGTAFSSSFDGQGRIKLPDPLREYAGIGDTAVVVGVNARVELWSDEGWKAEQPSSEEQAAQIIESLGE
jgi:MraZ protein